MKRITAFLATVLIFSGITAGEKKVDVNNVLDAMDKVYRSDSSEIEMKMIVVTSNWKRTMKIKTWSKGMDKTFITILSPRKDKGVSTLRVDNEMWNYFPKVNKVMKVPPSMMMGSWMGSDFTNDDLVKENTYREDYTAKIIPSKEKDLIAVEMKPKKNAVSVWGKIVAKVRKIDYLPVSQDFYDEKGKKMRVITFSDIKEIGGKTIPSKMRITPVNKEGQYTEIIFSKGKFDIKMDKGIFTLRNLQKKR
jgi:outer membrane lipoprotein-sorting protein